MGGQNTRLEGGAPGERAGHQVRGGSTSREGGAAGQRAEHRVRGRSTRPDGEAPGKRAGQKVGGRATVVRWGHQVRGHSRAGYGYQIRGCIMWKTWNIVCKKKTRYWYWYCWNTTKHPRKLIFNLLSQMRGLMIFSSSTVLHKLVAEGKGLMICSSCSSNELLIAGSPAAEWTTTVTWQILSKLNSSFRSVSTLIKKKIGVSYLRKFRRDQLQSQIWITASSYMTKYLRIS